MADKKQKVLLKRSSTPDKMPNKISGSTVENGELFMNIASGANAINFLTTLKAGGNSGVTEDYIKWSDDKYNEKKYSPITHNHDDRYYTETEIDGKLIKKSDTGHTHSATAITSGTLDIARIPTGTGSKQVALGNHDHDDVYATIKDVEDNELIVSTAINKIIESVGLNEDCSTQFDDGESLTSIIQNIQESATTWSDASTKINVFMSGNGISEAFDTLKEIQTYIDADSGRTVNIIADLNNKVNKTDRINSAYTSYSAITSVSATTAKSATTADKAVKDGNGNNIVNTYLTKSHVNASGTTGTSNNFGHVKLVAGELSGKTSAVNGEAAASYHKHSNYQPKGDYAAGSHVNATATTSAMGHVKLVSGNVSGKTYKDGEAAAASHNHDNVYQPKGSYLTSETYKGTITGVTAGTGLTGGGSASTGNKSVTLSLNTTYQNNIASGASAYTMVNALSGALIDVEYVVATALNTFNESAGFNEDGTSSLEGGETLSEAIGRLDEKPILRVGAGNVSAITVAVGGNISDNFIVRYANSATTATSATTANSATTAKSASTVTVNAGSTSSKYYLAGVTGTGTAYRSLYCRQEVWMTGGLLYASSDERLKNFTDDISVDFDALKKIPKKYFYWKDKDKMGDSRQIGTSAQKLAEIYPDIVNVDEEGNCGVSYERLSIIALAAIDKLHERIKVLEEKLKDK